ncbi:MAG: alpha/beta hydrolase [Sandaracinus sp.]|nr:alpha/beta hydrolase [Sandaracinus sp.]MCB9618163.1 alpha/beta hydrolase [Sandaracinus sp.]MCB9625325.1 alpha/beta hydrolase [Sandaracinus sp.]MCB9633421.1 alpha/beta hydrolase [Sandaracinus sp.]
MSATSGRRICRLGFDRRGEGEPLVLLQGLAWPRVHWDDALCDRLAEVGFEVIRVDARDVGQSEVFGGTPPSIGAVVQAALAGQPVEGALYDLSDMAADVIALLDSIGVARAHVCGVSLGGMIAQTLAIEHPSRVRSLTSVMTSTGDPNRVLASSDALRLLFTPIPGEREAAIAHQVKAFRVLSGGAFDEARTRRLASEAFELHAHVPGAERQRGAARQLVALLASGDRAERLRALTLPTLIVHGALDPLVPLDAGLDVAEAIEHADLLVLDDMAHDLAPPFWDAFVAALVDLRGLASG